MGPDRLQMQRLEYKYLIAESQAVRVREFVRSHLEPDEYGANQPNGAYAIHSLYLDSDDLKTYWDTINANRNRFKLRLRYYHDDPDSPVFFEIKRRLADAILKQRGGVRRVAVPGLLAGQLPEPEHLLSTQPKQFVALQRFSQIMLSLQAGPKAHVTYFREAWISTQDNSVRVTMDRNVRVAPEFTSRLLTRMGPSVRPFGEQVILELKFTGRFPNWFRHLVEAFNLRRGAAAKYAEGVVTLGEDVFYRDARQRLNGLHPVAGSDESGMDIPPANRLNKPVWQG
ncbi:MAG: polyphosphate polymerase domain-containing protein [Verrucomicrobiales bacterium]|nr:polyphosphate polymerase domain-containing protein [Verrucomicrobiales bacterium]